jgi:membrane protease YdiL (CAAX protease family)
MPSDEPLDLPPDDEPAPVADDALSRPPTGYQPEAPAPPRQLDVYGRPLTVARLRPPHPGFWFSFLWCIGFLLVTQVPGALVFAFILIVSMLADPAAVPRADNPGGPQAAITQSPAWNVGLGSAVVVTEVLVVSVSWLVIRLIVGREWPRRLALRRPGLSHLILVLVACPAMMLLANGFYLFLRSVVGLKGFADWGLGGMEEMVKSMSHWPVAFGIVFIGAGAGVGEELWCRGFLGRGLVGRYGALGVVASSFFFGLIHIDPPQAVYAMVVGLWLHFVYLTTRSLLVPMLLHFLNNSVSVIATHWTPLQQIDQDVGTMPLWVFAGAALLLTGAGWALYQSRARLAAEDGVSPPLWQPPYPGVEYPPPGSGTRVIHPRPSPAAIAAAAAGLLAFLGSVYLVYSRG